jgi:L-malate glycosyltransferase
VTDLRVAYFVDKSAPFFVGGYEVRAFELAKLLGRKHDFRVYTSLTQNNTTLDGVTFRRVAPITFNREISGGRSLPHGALFALGVMRNPFRDWSPDVVIVESIPYAHLMTMASWMSRFEGPRLLNVNEAWHSYSYFTGPLGPISRVLVSNWLRKGIKWSSQVMAISKATSDSLRIHYGVTKPKVVPMGIHFEYLTEFRANRDAHPYYDFAFVGRLVRIKRVEDLLLALSILQREHRWEGHAAIIGSGPRAVDLMALAKNIGIEKNVDFLGFKEGVAKYDVLRRSSAFVLPSEREGFSIASLEAMGCGLPVIAADPGLPEVFGTSDFVQNEETGLQYPVGDCNLLADCMWRLCSDSKLRSRLSLKAIALSAQYDWDRVANCLDGLICGIA